MTPPVFPNMNTPTGTKRVVIQHTQGLLKDMHQILGTVGQLMEGLAVADLPTFLGPLNFPDHEGFASLITVRPRFVHYRETMEGAEQLGTFNKEQR